MKDTDLLLELGHILGGKYQLAGLCPNGPWCWIVDWRPVGVFHRHIIKVK